MNDLLLVAMIASRRCAFRALDVRSVLDLEVVVPVPLAPSHVLGLTTRRSQTITVIDCCQALGLAPVSNPIGKRAAVIEYEGHLFALLVDTIDDISQAISEPRDINGGFGEGWSHAAIGIVETDGEPALLLDPAHLIEPLREKCAAA